MRVGSSFARLFTALLTALVAPVEGAARAADPDAADALVGTWHVLIHYQRPEGSDPERWLWDERVWVIEREGDGLGWTEHAIVSFQDETGRFEDLGTSRARRLTGAWEPNEEQRLELATGVAVSSRGMGHKHLARSGPASFRSDPRAGAVGASADGVVYHELWSIELAGDRPRFAIEKRFQVGTGEQESGGVFEYEVTSRPESAWQGRYRYADERHGRFAVRPTRIVVADDRDDPSRRPDALGSLDAGGIEFVPDQRIHSDVPLLVSVLRPMHYYGERRITIDSSPPGAELDLAYLRRGSQLLYRRGRAPLEVQLPTRLQAGPADRLLVRGFLPGHERTRESVAVDGDVDELLLTLPPLQNQLRGVAHGHLAGRSVIELATDEQPTLRVARDERGWTAIFVRTGLSDELADALLAISDPQLRVAGRQLGDDLVVRVERGADVDLDLRERVLADASRGRFRTRLEIGPRDPGPRFALLEARIDALGPDDLDACGPRFESALREELTPQVLAASLGRADHAEAPLLRAALRRMADVAPDHDLRERDGAVLRVGDPLEFELAWTRSAEIEGYLAWLATAAARIEPRDRGRDAFRSLVAPGFPSSRFAALFESARQQAEECRRSASARDVSG